MLPATARRLTAAGGLAMRSATPCRGLRPRYYPSEVGVVASAGRDSVVVTAGLSRAALHALVTFQGGAVGIVTELRADGTVCVDLLDGVVAPRETAVTDGAPLRVQLCDGIWGRVLDPLGQPIDGRGALRGARSAGHAQPLFADAPSLVARAPLSAVVPTGVKALDAFHPLLRGSSLALVGAPGTGTGTGLALQLVEHLAQLSERASCGGLLPLPPSACDPEPRLRLVYVAGGMGTPQLRDVVRRLRATGAASHVAVVAAPVPHARVGARWLAAVTGAAIADWVRDAGGHALVVYDSLSDHEAVSSSGGRVRDAAPASHAAQLLERCAQLSAARGGGSATALVLVTQPGALGEAVTPDTARARDSAAQLASLAGASLPLVARAPADQGGPVVPLAFEALPGQSGHAAQGAALRHYVVQAGSIVLAQLGEAARGAALAGKYGVDPEAEADALLELHTKARALLVPSAALLEALNESAASLAAAGGGGAAGALGAPAAVARLGLGGLDYLGRGGLTARRPPVSPVGADGSIAGVAGAVSNVPAASSGSHSRRSSLLARLDPAMLALVQQRSAAGGSGLRVPRIHAGPSRDGAALAGGSPPTANNAADGLPLWQPATESSAVAQAVPLERVPFRPPIGRAAPEQLLAEAAAAPLGSLAADSAGGGVPPPSVRGLVSRSPPLLLHGGPPFAPHTGDPARTLLTLFLLAHSYTSLVPLARLLEWEAGLFAALSAVPATPALVSRARLALLAASRDAGGCSGADGVLRVAAGSRGVPDVPSLLELLLLCPPPPSLPGVGDSADVAADMREALHRRAKRSVYSSDDDDAITVAADAPPDGGAPAQPPVGFFRWLLTKASVVQGGSSRVGVPPRPSGGNAPATAAAQPSGGHGRADSLPWDHDAPTSSSSSDSDDSESGRSRAQRGWPLLDAVDLAQLIGASALPSPEKLEDYLMISPAQLHALQHSPPRTGGCAAGAAGELAGGEDAAAASAQALAGPLWAALHAAVAAYTHSFVGGSER